MIDADRARCLLFTNHGIQFLVLLLKRPEVRSASGNWVVTIWLITRRICQSMSQMTFKIIFFLGLKQKFPAVKIFAFLDALASLDFKLSVSQ